MFVNYRGIPPSLLNLYPFSFIDIRTNSLPVVFTAVAVKKVAFWAVHTFKIVPAACSWAFRYSWAIDCKYVNCWRAFIVFSSFSRLQLYAIHTYMLLLLLLLRASCSTQNPDRERACCTVLRFIVRLSGFGASGAVAAARGVLSLEHPTQQRQQQQHIAPQNASASYT